MLQYLLVTECPNNMCIILNRQPVHPIILLTKIILPHYSRSHYLLQYARHTQDVNHNVGTLYSHSSSNKLLYPPQPEGICFQLIDAWLDFHVENAASDLICFTYFGVTTSHTACGQLIISALHHQQPVQTCSNQSLHHLNPASQDEISAMMRASVVSWVPLMTEGLHPLHPSPWRVGLMVTQTLN